MMNHVNKVDASFPHSDAFPDTLNPYSTATSLKSRNFAIHVLFDYAFACVIQALTCFPEVIIPHRHVQLFLLPNNFSKPSHGAFRKATS